MKKKWKQRKETRQRRDKGHAVKTSDGPRERRNQEGKKKGTKQRGTHKTFDKEIVGVGTLLPPVPPLALARRLLIPASRTTEAVSVTRNL